MNKEINFRQAVALIAAVGFILSIIVIGASKSSLVHKSTVNSKKIVGSQETNDLSTMKRFSSEDDFKKYLEKSQSLSAISAQTFFGGMRQGLGSEDMEFAPMTTQMTDKTNGAIASGGVTQRFSQTNVQVAGIDEPDVVKIDGKEIYFSPTAGQGIFYPLSDPIGGDIMPVPPRNFGEIKNIRAFPVENLKLDGKIDRSGDLLLSGDNLIVLPTRDFPGPSGSKIFGYDVSDPSSPEEKWNVEIKDNNQLVDARLKDGRIFAVIRNHVDSNHPCLLDTLAVNGKPFSLSCVEIYHPVLPIPVDSVYTVLALDPATGEVKDTTSFVGSQGESVVYMSPSSIYVTFYYPGDFVAFATNFLKENGDLVPDWLIEKMEKLKGYDLSARAKQAELEDAMNRFENALGADEKRRIDNELRNRMQDYFAKHKRELEQTSVAKISTDNLDIEASGTFPGKPLNQFSLDEYNNHLRIATTVGSGWWGFGFGGTRNSANDVYVLDGSLQTVGSIQDLGLDERIYSARFVEDRGYLVTFRETDPFYVLDLSNPEKPEKKGELHLPGFSSYLHPLAKDRILGVGSENGQVKASLFDVSNPSSPREAAKYNLDEYYTEISETHHAFLNDPKYKIFFLPGADSGYIFSYEGDNLKLMKAITGVRARRAVFVNDFLYIIGDSGLSVVEEKNWQTIKTLDL